MLVVGPSGSGKSTLALAISGLIPADIPASVSGELRIDGVDGATLDTVAIGARVGLVFQDSSSQIVMERVEDDVAFGLENRAWPRSEMLVRVPEALDEEGLSGLQRWPSRRLSGGQQQRLALAGALAPRPGLLVLDEPTANLDPPGAAALMASLARIRQERTATIILIEHRVDEAWPLADVVLALDGSGAAIDVGPPGDVAARSATRMREAGIWLPASVDEPRPSPFGPPVAPGEIIVTASSVRFGYDRASPVLRDVDMTAAAGERIALVGPNGSGKSTLARLLVGLLRPDRGEVRLRGDAPSSLPASTIARRAGYVFQEPERQFLTATITDEVTIGLTPEERSRVEPLMERLRLPLGTFGSRSPYRLSGGEQRRLSLACVLVRRPDVVVLDEPTFGQDRHGYEGLLEILGEHLDHGACLISATHDERFVRDVATRVVTLEDGWVASDEAVA